MHPQTCRICSGCWAVLLLGWSWLPSLQAAAVAGSTQITTVRGLRALMYREQKGTGGAYLLLNATATIGSGVPPGDSDYVQAPLQHWARFTSGQLTEPASLLVPAADTPDFMKQWQQRSDLLQNVVSVLVDDSEAPAKLTSLGPFPQAEYAPYTAGSWQWNPGGSPLASTRFPAPVMLLGEGLAADAQERADHNALKKRMGRLYYSRVGLTMLAKHNSSHCLAKGNCKPLGGFSVWAALPPLDPAKNNTKPITLVVAQIDGIDMFHDEIVMRRWGANSPSSGLIAMLLASRILQQHLTNVTAPGGNPGTLFQQRQLVFLALAGEPWGYMGSRRLLWELSQGSPTVAGLNWQLVDQVVELGSIGRCRQGSSSNTCTLYAHRQQPPDFGNATTLLQMMQQGAADVPGAQVTLTPASSSNPGIPPSSLMSFLRVNASIAGLVLTEFDSSIQDPLYASRFDQGGRVNATAIAGVAAAVAAGLVRIAGGDPAALKVNLTETELRAASLVGCLLLPDPGLACRQATNLIAPGYRLLPNGTRLFAARHYVGVLQTLPPDLQWPQLKDDVYRFLWNLLAVYTAMGAQGDACDPYSIKCPAGQVCAGWKQGNKDPALMGRCFNATVRYVPSYSTRISCTSCEDWLGAFTWVTSTAADAWNALYGWPQDPMWVESDWPLGVPYVQLYLREPVKNDVAVLIAGAVVTVAAVVLCALARRAFDKVKLH